MAEEESKSPFKVGEAVRHKTGGPKMIYIGDDTLGQAICSWMASSRKQTDTFVHDELEPYSEPTSTAWSGSTTRA